MTRLNRTVDVLGYRLPLVVVGLMVATLAASILGANSRGVAGLITLIPAGVWQGEVWRLLTWTLFEPDALSLLFWLMLMFFIGRDLAYAWGPVRLLGVYFGLAGITGLVVTLIGWWWRALGFSGFYTAWAVADGLFIAWARRNPHVQVRFMFVLPISGQNLIPATFALTGMFALLSGAWWRFIPHFVAMTSMLFYGRSQGVETAWLKLRYRWLQWRSGRRRSHLRVVDRKPEGEPPRWLH